MAELNIPYSTAELRELFEAELEAIFNSPLGVPALVEAARYGVFPAGKRIRPVLALAWCADLGGDPRPLIRAAAALELIHCASLIHDDLPALDNDDFRRGRPSCHRAFTEATAILAGDMLVSLAHRCVVEAPLSADARLILTDVLARANIDLCAGQALDLVPPVRRSELTEIHRFKTGALFSACLVFGGVGAGQGAPALARSAELGHAVGLLFQIADDFIDAHGTDAARGRPGSSDARNGKPNFFSSPALNPQSLIAEAERTIDSVVTTLAPSGAPRTSAIIAAVRASLNRTPVPNDASV